jgi:uracil-DNA glycosylase
MFTGDRSGDFLYAGLYRAGFANQPVSAGIGDGLGLSGCLISAVVRCAPPQNHPTPEEISNCTRWLLPDLLDSSVEVIVALGGLAFAQILRVGAEQGWSVPRPRPAFGHGVELQFGSGPVLLGCYHPSQQNTFTGKLTPEMLDRVLLRAKNLAGNPKQTRQTSQESLLASSGHVGTARPGPRPHQEIR